METQVLFELPTVLRIYADGQVERFPQPELSPPGVDPLTLTTSKDVDIDPEASVRARIYLPEPTSTLAATKLPVLVYYHGGGFITGSTFEPSTHNYLNVLAAQAKILIVSVEYRLAPENPIPIPYEDSWAALKWAVSGSDATLSDHGDLSRVFLAGESAGANIAHNMAMRVGKRELGSKSCSAEEVEGLVLIHPLFWGSERIGSETEPNPNAVLNADQLDAGWQLVCGPQEEEVGLDNPRLNPWAEGAPGLDGLGCKRVLVNVGGRDLLRERGRVYVERLKGSGWEGTAEILESEGEDHGFHLERPEGDKAQELLGRLVHFFGGQ